MATTTNFGWETPDDTDLVKDGALAIRTLGSAIDSSLVDLKGGTTGQILSKTSNTDLDYTWINNDQGDITEVQAGTGISVASGTGPIPVITNTVATAFDAAGDLVYGTGADTFTKLAIGTAGQVLQVNSGATAPEWATPSSSGGQTLISTTSLTGASITLSSIPTTYKHLYLVLKGVYLATVGSCTMQLNGDTGNNYSYSYVRYRDATAGIGYNQGFSNIGGIFEAQTATTATKLANAEIVLPRYTDTDTQPVYIRSYGSTATATTWYQTVGSYDNSAAITSIKLTPDFNFSGGTAYLYGVA